MDFGRLHIDETLDLQIFGVERDQVSAIVDAIAPGIVGAIVLADPSDVVDPHYTKEALDELGRRGISCIVASVNADTGRLSEALGSDDPIILVKDITKDTAKDAILSLLQDAAQQQAGVA